MSVTQDKFVVVILQGFAVGTSATLVDATSDSGFSFPFGLQFTTTSDPYNIRFPWQGPNGKYTLRWKIGGANYAIVVTIVP